MPSAEFWAGIGSVLAFILGLFSLTLNYHETITLWMNKIQALFTSYIEVTIPEYGAEHLERSDFYVAIEAYLSEHCATGARKLKAELGSHRDKPLIYVDDGQQITDTFTSNGSTCKIWWHAYKGKAAATVSYRPGEEERRFYRVSFHHRFRLAVVHQYLPQVIEQGRQVISTKRQRRLFTNNPDSRWSSVAFQHPATFDTLAMDFTVKMAIYDDLCAFKAGKDYYARVCKPWKRGYLLFGPPGTGKSAMVSAMATLLNYDTYDLELTAVKSNNDLRRLFIDTTGKSILVIRDIDRFVDFRRGDNKNKRVVNIQPTTAEQDDANKYDDSQQLTVSGLLNFIDRLWSVCGGERIIVFITNNKDKLDPALIRPDRIDMHIEMSYCTYEAFKELARIYLDVIDEHHLFERFSEIQQLLEVAEMSQADVAECLMRKGNEVHGGACLEALVAALKKQTARTELEKSM